MVTVKINSVQDLKDAICDCLDQDSLDIEIKTRQEAIKNIKGDSLFADTYVLRFDLNSARLYDIEDGGVMTIDIELIAAFSLLEKSIPYILISRVRSEMLHSTIPETGQVRDDYTFITRFIDLFDFCTSIDHQLFNGNTDSREKKDITRIIADLDRLDTGLMLEFLSEEVGINSIQPIHVSSLKYGDKYI